MPCDTNIEPIIVKTAVQLLEEELRKSNRNTPGALIEIEIDLRTGMPRIKGWNVEQRQGVGDACALLKLVGTQVYNDALALAETRAGIKANTTGMLAGFHSHDGGKSWGKD